MIARSVVDGEYDALELLVEALDLLTPGVHRRAGRFEPDEWELRRIALFYAVGLDKFAAQLANDRAEFLDAADFPARAAKFRAALRP